MKKRLPKATLSTLDDIHSETANTAADSAEPAAETAPEAAATEVPPEQSTTVVALAPLHDSANRELRQAQALNIVERYTTYSALGGCIPLAIFDTISVSAVIFNMVRALAEHYQTPFQRDRVKAGVAALLAGVATPSLGNVATRLAGKLIPGAWLISTAVSSAAAAALTRYIGNAFIEHLESGGTTLNFDMTQILARFRKTAAA
ncbi:MAG: DUF697 domain-containing protein [Sulfuricella sp.]|nr:DUF697 domain-containing protein [Sulfuricella sp.]